MRKIISLILVFSLVFGCVCYADDGYDTNLIASEIYSQIPSLSEYQDVSIFYHPEGYSANFSSYGKNSASVNTDANGTVLNYSLSYILGVVNKLPNITSGVARDIALQFISNAAKDILSQLDLKNPEITYSGVSTSEYSVHFSRMINNIPYSADSVTVWIDGHSGTVVKYMRNWDSSIIIDDSFSVMPLDMAQAEYRKNVGISLRYIKSSESPDNIKLVYTQKNTGYINAIDGTFIPQTTALINNQYEQIIAQYQKTAIDSNVSIHSGDKNTEDFLIDKAKAFLKGLSIDMTEIVSLKYYYLSDTSIAELIFKNKQNTLKILLDSNTSDLVGFSLLDAPNIFSSVFSDETLLVAENFINTHFAKYKNELSAPVINSKTDSKGTEYEIFFTRTPNGIPFFSNGIQLIINGYGQITSASVAWDNLSFPKAENIIPQDIAEMLFFEKIGIVSAYIKNEETSLIPVFSANPAVPNIIDASSGAVLNYDGTKHKQTEDFSYTDLQTHYSRKQAQTLLNCGIFISSGEISLEDYIQQKDFIKLLANIFPKSLPIYGNANRYLSDSELEMLYNFFVTEDILEKNEINPTGLISRENAVKYIINTIGYKEVAEFDGIFLQSFADYKEISPALYGYIALAKGFGIITGSGENFNPKEPLKCGDALIMIYNYLN